MSDKLIIFDTTLRDGEQSPGASMTKDEKVRIAKSLERMQVDIIEAGFPIASVGDFESVQAVANAVTESRVCGLARALDNDIDRAGEALKDANASRIHTFIATSPIHMKMKLRMSPEQVIENAVKAVTRARQYTDDVEFSPEDAGRSETDFLCRILEAVIDAGATTLNIPDTVGYNLPHQFGQLIYDLRKRIPNSDKAIFSVHCHNDLGLAVANSLSAVLNGARQVECTINGLGERAGNAALEELVMAIRTRQDMFSCDSNIDTTQILAASRLVSGITGFVVQPNKAIVGANAFAHESGIHQDGVLKSRETYEIMRAEDVGWNANRMVMGKHSGRNAFRTRLQELNIEFESETELNAAFRRFKELADKKHEIFDADLQALVSDSVVLENERIRLISLKVCSETGETPVASVTLSVDDQENQVDMAGSGPVDAALRAIEGIVQSNTELQLYSVNNITSGTDSQGEVNVRLEKDGRIVSGQGADTDIVIASAKAYIHALKQNISACRSRASPSMRLGPGQVSTLNEMGIPVWELRGQQSDNFATDSEPNLEEFTEKLLSHDWIIITDQHAYNESTERLLQSMLLAIGIPSQQYIIVPDSYIEHIHLQSIKPKILLVFGDKTVQKTLGSKASVDNSRGKIHQILHPELTTIVSFGLDELLIHPENKVFAWLDLQLARSVSEQWK